MLRSLALLAGGLGAAWQLHSLGDADVLVPTAVCRHGFVELAQGAPVPQLRLSAQPDAVSGWNLRIETEHFRFSPEHVNGLHVAGEGHAHLYVDGRKHSRLYGSWLHLPSLGAGSHELRVTLNANDHREIALGGKLIQALARVKE